MYKRTTRVERLARKEEKTLIKRIIYLSFLSLILAIFIFTLGIPLLGKFTDVLSLLFKKNETVTTNNIPQAPRLDTLPAATNSARLALLGYSTDGAKVEIYLDLKKTGEVSVVNGKFSYEDLTLQEGQNQIAAKAISQTGKASDFSVTLTIILDKAEPKLDIETPLEGQSFSQDNKIKVSGKTDVDAQVFANGFLANVDSNGHFEVLVPVNEGENTIEVKAVDEAGNIKIETRKISYKK